MTDEWLAGLRWTAAPRHTQWGAGMMEALVPLGNDHTLRLYAEAEALHLVGPALSGTNRDAPADEAADAIERLARALRLVMSCAGDIDAASDASLESALECDDEATKTQATSGGGFVERELAVARGLAACRGDDARLDEADAEIADLRQACREGWRYAAKLEDERKRLQAELDRVKRYAAVALEVCTSFSEVLGNGGSDGQ